MSERSTLTILAEEVANALAPLAEAISSPENFTAFMQELGWNLTTVPQPFRDLSAPSAPLQDIIDIVEAGTVDSSNVGDLISAIKALITALKDLKGQPDDLFPASVNAEKFKNEVPEQLLRVLLVDYLLDSRPFWGNLLKTLGLLRVEVVDASGDRPAYWEKEILWDRLGEILTDPFDPLRKTYKWGTSAFDGDLLLENAVELLLSRCIEVRLNMLEDKLFAFLTAGALNPDEAQQVVALTPIVDDQSPVVATEMGIGLFILPETAGAKPGFAILPYGKGTVYQELDLSEEVVLRVQGDIDLTAGVGILVRPDQGIQVLVQIIPSVDEGVAPPSSGSLAVSLQNRASATERQLLFGSEGSSRFEVGTISIEVGARTPSDRNPAVYTEFEMRNASLVIDLGDADALLRSLLPEDGFALDFNLRLGFSSSQGFYFGGSGGLAVNLPTHLQAGPIEIISSTLAVKVRDGTIPVEIGASVKIARGPLQVVTENLGLRTTIAFKPDYSGELGPVDLALGFKPPDGAGLSIEAGPVSGGGFLQRDAGPPERYAGALALRLTRFSVNAFGVFERSPSGAIAFVMVLGIRFLPAFQLGFGFALTGIGGLVGINRRADIDALRERLISGTASNVLFAEDPIRNAPTLFGDLRALFPTADGIFVVGPTFQIGWFALARFDLGIIVELPGPSKIVLLGSARLQIGGEGGLPPLVQIRLDIVGVIDFVKKLIAFDAVLVNSRLLQIFHLTGSAAFRLSTGDRPYVLLTIGGFHPAFNPEPIALPPQNRVALTYDTGGSVRLSVRLEAYLAVTSNTFQTGAALEVEVVAEPLNALGFLGFDALIQFDPFYFAIDFFAGFRVRLWSITLAGVSFAGSLSGPGPLVLSGTFCIEILFFKICWSGSFALGQESGDGLQPIGSLLQALTPELEKRANLEASGGEDREVAVAPSRVASSALVAPYGQLIWRQKRAPLNVLVERLEGVPLSRRQAVVVASAEAHESVQEWFSPGTFINLSESEALNRAAFERLDAGLRLGFGSNWSSEVLTTLEIETIVLSEEVPLAPSPSDPIILPPVLQDAIESRRGLGRVFEAPPVIRVDDETWAVHSPTGFLLSQDLSQTDAHQRVRQRGGTATPARDEPIELGAYSGENTNIPRLGALRRLRPDHRSARRWPSTGYASADLAQSR